MDQDDAPVGKILTRRQALQAAAVGGFGLALAGAWSRAARAAGPSTAPAARAAATTQPQLHLIATPALTEGPFFVDEKLNRSNLLEGTQRPTVVNGLPLLITFTLYQITRGGTAPLSGAHIDVWNADASGAYSDESDPMNRANTAGQRWLRGFQVTGADGSAAFQTIFTGWYNGRTPHVHFKVRQFNAAGTKATTEFTSQLFFTDADRIRIYSKPPYSTYADGDTTNAQDDIFNQRQPDGTRAGDLLTLKLQPHPNGKGHAARIAIGLTDGNLVPAGTERARGGPGGRPGFGPPGDFGGRGGPPPPPDGWPW